MEVREVGISWREVVKWMRVLRNKKKIGKRWEVLSEKGRERVLEPWVVGMLGAEMLKSNLVL